MEPHQCPFFDEKRRRGRIETNRGLLYLCTNHAVKSSRLFKEKRSALSDALPRVDEMRDEIEQDVKGEVKRHIHNLVSLNGQSIQLIYSVIPQDIFFEKDHEKVVSNVRDKIRNNPQEIADLIINLLKNENLEKN
jgi:hypothetical protein